MNLGILGGMGPMATADFFRKVIETTESKSDQDHIHIFIDNNTNIPDRTSYIKNGGDNPKIEMRKSLIRLENMGADYIAIPCNTAHYFYDDIKDYIDKPIVHMIYETMYYAKSRFPKVEKFLLLATEGTYLGGTYENIFKSEGLDIITPDTEDKAKIMEWIYDLKGGQSKTSLDDIEGLCSKYVDLDQGGIILGCTELPILFQNIYGVNLRDTYIDPTLILAKKCVELCRK